MPDRGLLLALLLTSCISSAETVSFEADVLPILNQYCVMCHIQGAEQAELVLYPDAWSQLVGKTSSQSELSRVEPGNADKSYLYLKLIGTELQQSATELLLQAVGNYASPYVRDALVYGYNEPSIGPEYAAPLAPQYFNVRKTSIYAGSNEIQRNIMAKAILGM